MVLGAGEGSVDIIMPKDVYSFGETIKGKVVLKLNQPKNAKGFRIELFARRTEGSGKHKRTITVLYQKLDLKGQGEIGDSEYEFEFAVPNNEIVNPPPLPKVTIGPFTFAQYQSPIQWHIAVTLDLPMSLDVNSKKKIRVMNEPEAKKLLELRQKAPKDFFGKNAVKIIGLILLLGCIISFLSMPQSASGDAATNAIFIAWLPITAALAAVAYIAKWRWPKHDKEIEASTGFISNVTYWLSIIWVIPFALLILGVFIYVFVISGFQLVVLKPLLEFGLVVILVQFGSFFTGAICWFPTLFIMVIVGLAFLLKDYGDNPEYEDLQQ